MSEKEPICFGRFMDNIGNPNCDVCYLRTKCYEMWKKSEEVKKREQTVCKQCFIKDVY